MSTVLLACWHGVRAVRVRPPSNRQLVRSISLPVHRRQRATCSTVLVSAGRARARRVARMGSVGEISPSFSPSRPLTLSLTLAPHRCSLATQRRRGRFLSIDPLLTPLDQSQATTTYRPRGMRRERYARLVGIVRRTREAPRPPHLVQ